MIKTIVFDFGNVLIGLDQDTCVDRLNTLCNRDAHQQSVPESFKTLIMKYETGQVSDEHFIWRFQQYNPEVNPVEYVKAWNSMITTMQEEVIVMLSNLKDRYQLAILSNINPFHARHIDNYIKTHPALSKFFSFFDHVFYSHELKMRKPDIEIYQTVQEKLNCEVHEVLFIDDLEENVSAALEYGWNSVQHNPAIPISTVIADYIKVNQQI